MNPWRWEDAGDLAIARRMFIMLQKLELMERTTSFHEFVEWTGSLSWYAQIYKPK
jgi:hypothetical protein